MAHILMPTDKIVKKLGFEPDGSVQTFFTNACYRYMDKYVPYDNGDLRSIVTLNSNSITYEVPYASYQYFGIRKDGTHKVENYTTDGTCSYWDRRMISAEGKDLTKEVAEYVRRKL